MRYPLYLLLIVLSFSQLEASSPDRGEVSEEEEIEKEAIDTSYYPFFFTREIHRKEPTASLSWEVFDLDYFAIQGLFEAQKEDLYTILRSGPIFSEKALLPPDDIFGLIVAYTTVSTTKAEKLVDMFATPDSEEARDAGGSVPIFLYTYQKDTTLGGSCSFRLSFKIGLALSLENPWFGFSLAEEDLYRLKERGWQRDAFLSMMDQKIGNPPDAIYSLLRYQIARSEIALWHISKDEADMYFPRLLAKLKVKP